MGAMVVSTKYFSLRYSSSVKSLILIVLTILKITVNVYKRSIYYQGFSGSGCCLLWKIMLETG